LTKARQAERKMVMEKAKVVYKEDGNKATIKSIDVSAKFEKSVTYFVVNEKVSGRFER